MERKENENDRQGDLKPILAVLVRFIELLEQLCEISRIKAFCILHMEKKLQDDLDG